MMMDGEAEDIFTKYYQAGTLSDTNVILKYTGIDHGYLRIAFLEPGRSPVIHSRLIACPFPPTNAM